MIETIYKFTSSTNPKIALHKNRNLLMKKRSKLFYLLPALAFIGCAKDTVEEVDGNQGIVSPQGLVGEQINTEVANPDAPTSISEVYFAGNKIPVEKMNENFVYQGDIMLSNDMVSYEPVKLVFEKGEKPPANKSVARTSGRWPNNTVYYSIDSNLPDKSRVYNAISHWEAKTNLDFVERTDQRNYLHFIPGAGCSSYVGMVGGEQAVTLSEYCTTGNAIHEIGHSIGLWHEQSRVDRENYITINYDNIQSGRDHNFYTYKYSGFDGEELTSALDFGSIMMYGSYSFSANGRPTIVRKNGTTFSGQRNGLSSGDISGVNNMYPYSSGGGTTVAKEIYSNGQYYTIEGLTVLRFLDRWYYNSRYGTREVILIDGTWYYA